MSEKILCFIFSDQRLLLTKNMEIPLLDNLFFQQTLLPMQLRLDYHSIPHITAELPANVVLPTNMQLRDLKELLPLLPANIIALAGKARQLLEWNKAHQFCGACGSPTIIATREHSRTCINDSCQRIFFPKISPVVIVAVERDQEILLARSPHFPPEIYSVLAGFVEPGESVEESVHREVFEETGITIKNLRYFSSQPWPFPSSLMLGFQADYAAGEIICAANEIEDAAFFHIDAMPKIFPGKTTISQWLIRDFFRRHGYE